MNHICFVGDARRAALALSHNCIMQIGRLIGPLSHCTVIGNLLSRRTSSRLSFSCHRGRSLNAVPYINPKSPTPDSIPVDLKVVCVVVALLWEAMRILLFQLDFKGVKLCSMLLSYKANTSTVFSPSQFRGGHDSGLN